MSIHDNLNSPLLKRVKENEKALDELQEVAAGSPTKIATGTDVYIGDGAALPIIDFKLTGKSVQNGTPTPDAPIAIDNSGDCVEMIQGAYSTSTGVYSSDSTIICNKNPISCTSGDIVNIECDDAENIRVLFYNESGFVSTEVLVSSGATVPSGVTHFNFNVNNTNGISVDTVGKILLIINGKYALQIPYANKNLLTIEDVTQTVKGVTTTTKDNVFSFSGTATSSGGRTQYFAYYHLPSGIYYLSTQEARGTFAQPCINNVATSSLIATNNAKFELTEETFVGLGFNVSEGVTYDGMYKLQIERGEVSTEWEKPIKKVATVLLNAPFCETDVMSRTEVVRKRGTVVLNGSENWMYWGTEGDNYGVTLDNAFTYNNAFSNTTNALSNRFVPRSGGRLPEECLGLRQNGDTQYRVYLSLATSRLSEASVNGVKEWLAENPITLEYELAEPIIETLDSASQAALNAIETFNPITHITVDSRIKPEISVEYVHEAYESIVNSLNNRIAADEWKPVGEVTGRTHLTLPEGWKELDVVAYSFPFCAAIHMTNFAVSRSSATLTHTLPLTASCEREVQIRINTNEVYLWKMFQDGEELADDAGLITNLHIAAYYK